MMIYDIRLHDMIQFGIDFCFTEYTCSKIHHYLTMDLTLSKNRHMLYHHEKTWYKEALRNDYWGCGANGKFQV